MDLLQFINQQLNDQKTLEMLGKSVKAKPSQVEQLAKLGIPTIMQALNQNAKSPTKADSLAKALDQHQNDNVDDIESFLKNLDGEDAKKMLKHILSDKNDKVQTTLAKQTGLKANQVTGILSQLAPLLMGALAQEKKQQQVDVSGLAGLMQGLTSKTSSNNSLMDMVTNMLDADNDGSIVDDVGNILKGFMK
ncbi:MAG: DUF937 domain-containing protein [Erysipelotrichaceae bacterium]|nr:DUF937 domain-containing protein [Erysipelotrichaceae bacterium]